MEKAIEAVLDRQLDELADVVFYGFLYEDDDLEEFNQLIGMLDEKVVPIGKAKRKRIAKEYAKAKGKPLGSGARFAALVKGGMSPALAAVVGRKKHGKKKMAQLAAKGRKRAGRRMKKAA